MMDNQDILKRTETYCAGGPATLSKDVSRYPQEVTPTCFESGNGERVWDASGASYIDTVAALGPILLGHGHSRVQAAARAQMNNIQCSSMTTPVESRLAELMVAHIPCAEQVRFAINGADVTQAAVRAARYITGKHAVLTCGYHGMHDWYIATTKNNGGILLHNERYNRQFSWLNMTRVSDLAYTLHEGDVAAIIVEVPPFGPDIFHIAHVEFLKWLRAQASKLGAMFILDEIVTGMRYWNEPQDGSPIQLGAGPSFGIMPDMACYSKALGNGYPVSALVGPRDIMEVFNIHKHPNGPFLSSTFGAWPVGLAAAEAVIKALTDTTALPHLRTMGNAVKSGFEVLFADLGLPVKVHGDYARMVLHWEETEVAANVMQEAWRAQMMMRKIFTGVPFFPMTCYSNETVEEILDAANDTAKTLATARSLGSVTDLYPGQISSQVFERYDTEEDA